VALLILALYLFPALFKFKKYVGEPEPARKTVSFPSWFIPSIIILGLSWFFMWGRFQIVQPIDHFTFVPLWWSFIFLLDSIVYKRTGGISLIASRSNTMKIMAVTSAFSWFVFEYLNFFVLENWYYPNNHVFTNFGNIAWQLMSYTTVLPVIFEFYWLLRTFPRLRDRYRSGPVIGFSRPVMYVFMVLGLALMLLMGRFPFPLFWVLWVSLIPALVPAMSLKGMWTPFTPIARKGDWSPVLLIALATVTTGFFWEFWNFGSEWFHNDLPTNPNYWKYSVPYVDKFHIFSEMPILGYFGYMFFGNVCWVLWVTMGYLVGFNFSIHSHDEDGQPQPANDPE
jgi:hypothetical protein